MGLDDERGYMGEDTSAMALCTEPSGAVTAIRARWRDSIKPPRHASTSTGSTGSNDDFDKDEDSSKEEDSDKDESDMGLRLDLAVG